MGAGLGDNRSMSNRAPFLASRLQGLGTTIFAEMSALAEETGSVNLGQGFPDTEGPSEVLEAAIAAIRSGHNQYPPGAGVPQLREAVAAHQKRFYGLDVDPASEVLVTAGATEAITAAVLALCETGDEVLTFEPFYDSYGAAIAMAGARHTTVRLHAPDWTFDPAALARAVTPRTRLLLLNTPHNPTGKVFSAEELGCIAEVCCENDLIAVTDEVYEHLVFGDKHLPLASWPGMAARTLTVSSAGKTFSITGWKVGWVSGPEALVAAVRTAKQFLTYVSGAPFQPAVAVGLALPDEVFAGAAAQLQAGRDRLCEGLAGAGFEVYRPEAGYFVVVDAAPLGYADGAAACADLPRRCGVVGVPAGAFYADPAAAGALVRFAFCKRPEVLDTAVERLSALTRLRGARPGN